MTRPPRQSIEPTYDSTKTGYPYTITTRIDGRLLAEQAIADPFHRTVVTIGWRDVVRAALRRRSIEVAVHVSGSPEVIEDVLELDDDYLGRPGSSRRDDWNRSLQGALSAYASGEADT